ncbi:MAG: hypothetical protein KME01_05570 [Chroococcus sp. CMT-3BRIN-NPC107]|jgi:tRNA A37 methylthiotransferase MiaB|nr:hypothetical protein [Chroococcus sp. CMT-3BRIN-NPC107]
MYILILSTDALAGFSRETKAQLVTTLKLITDIVFNRISINAYFLRPGTAAALWDN